MDNHNFSHQKKTDLFSETIQLIRLAQENDKKAMENLLEKNAGLIWSIVKRFIGRGYEAEDLYQIGSIGFMKAIKRFDIHLEVQLSTYAVPYIMGEIKRFIRDDGLIKVSRKTKELAIKIKQLQTQYFNQTGKEISIYQIANILKISKEEIAAAIESNTHVDSIDSMEDTDSRSLIEKIADQKDEYNQLVNKITLKEIIEQLEEREKKVIFLRFYKEQTQSQVGKILGITQVQVSRIEKKVLEKMRVKLEAV